MVKDIKRIEKGLYTCGSIVIESEARMGMKRPWWQVKFNDRMVQACPNLRSAKHAAVRLAPVLAGYVS